MARSTLLPQSELGEMTPEKTAALALLRDRGAPLTGENMARALTVVYRGRNTNDLRPVGEFDMDAAPAQQKRSNGSGAGGPTNGGAKAPPSSSIPPSANPDSAPVMATGTPLPEGASVRATVPMSDEEFPWWLPMLGVLGAGGGMRAGMAGNRPVSPISVENMGRGVVPTEPPVRGEFAGRMPMDDQVRAAITDGGSVRYNDPRTYLPPPDPAHGVPANRGPTAIPSTFGANQQLNGPRGQTYYPSGAPDIPQRQLDRMMGSDIIDWDAEKPVVRRPAGSSRAPSPKGDEVPSPKRGVARIPLPR